MATSGTTDFTITRDEIISAALRKIGVVPQGETASAVQITEGAFALNVMVKAWEGDGMPLWAIKTLTIPYTAGTASYTIGNGATIDSAKPLKVIQAWNKDLLSNVDIPMIILTRYDYNRLGNKTSSGTPVQIQYTPERDTGTVTVFPVPDTAAETNNRLVMMYQCPFEDFDASTDNLDFPQEWYDAVIYGLATRLAPEYGLPVEQRQLLYKEAKEIKDAAFGFGTEEGSLYFGVDRR